jgi:squalene monooxygenase
VTVVQGTVTDLVRDDSPEGRVLGVEYRVSPESEPVKAYASVTVVADGCHSRFRKLLSAEEDEDVRIDVDSHFVGMIINDVTMDYDKMGNVFLIKPSPVLMYQIGSNDTRVLIDVAGKKLRPKAEIIEYCRDTVAPQLTDAVRPAFLRALEGGDIRSMPNQYMSARKITTPGIVVVGDASNMRHPLTGGGMTVAFTDVKLLTDMWAELPDLADWDAVELTRNRLFEARKEKVSAINVLSSALYSVFSVPQPDFEKLRSACFYYLKAGGWFLAGPVGLLSGLTPDPLLLVTHFFAVAVYGTYLTCSPFPTPSRFITSIKMIKEAADIMIPLLIRDKVTFLAPLGRLWYGSCTATPQQRV